MSKYDGKETFDIETLTRIICCDCGLVHEVSFYVKGEDTFVTFERNDVETEKVRIKRVGGKGKLFCLQLDEAIARDPVRPDNSYKESSQSRKERKSESVVVGTMIKSLLDNAKSRNRGGIRGCPLGAKNGKYRKENTKIIKTPNKRPKRPVHRRAYA